MKSALEVIAEMFIKGLEAKEDREQRKVMNRMFGKVVQLTLMNFNEAVVFFFEELEVDGKPKKWVRYESYPTPMLKCKKCGWKGTWKDLPREKVKFDVPEGDVKSILLDRVEETIEKCPKCNRTNYLYWKDWVHPMANVNLYVSSQWEVGKFGTLIVGPIHVRLKALINVAFSLLKGNTKITPFSALWTVINFGTILL
ncbi:MAG: hypothetical protein HWN67_20610 [Candidatus Helarchaeota archaeon]|nr:hypothetical protein [Candidatus Helarchaeota archaeon]